MKFKFRLEKIANYFTQKEFSKKLELAAILRELNRSKSLKESLERENQGLLKRQHQKCELGVEWLKLFMDRIDQNIHSIERLDFVISEQEQAAELKRKELQALTARKKALESMREKKESDFRVIENRKAQKRLDEAFQLLGATKR